MIDKEPKGSIAPGLSPESTKGKKRVSSSSSSATHSENVHANSKNTSNSSVFIAGAGAEQYSAAGGIKQIDDYIDVALDAVAVKVDAIYKEKLVLINQSERKLSQMISVSTTLLNDLEGKLSTVTDLTNRSIEIQNSLQEEIKHIKGNAISALAIFVSFFAFITVTLNVFSKAGSVVSAVVLVLIFWCLLIGFNLIIAVQFKVFKESKVIWLSLGGVILVSVLSVIGLYYFSPELRGVKTIFLFAT